MIRRRGGTGGLDEEGEELVEHGLSERGRANIPLVECGSCARVHEGEIPGVENMTCKKCEGFGLWDMGTPSPMGPMDAADGFPTLPCPECGADANPKKVRK